MFLHKIIPSVDYNWWLKRSDTQFKEQTNQLSPQSFKPTNKKILKFVDQFNKHPNVCSLPSFECKIKTKLVLL